ncbi:permease-like cell division protein FtsX [Actinomadura sp. 9N215]|uniref:permease-like cell division protein FtsX n=1 Tax=Actinomadura sp. 9N215 TaxID=3375150 RepID=UPI0037AE6A1E
MNEPEERLTDALKDVGETVRSGDVPPPPFPDRPPTTTPFSRPLVMGAMIAAFVVVMGGVVAGGYLAVDRTFGDRNAAASSERTVSVFLCTKSSSAQKCRGGDATEQQKQEIKRRLQAMRQARRVDYESKKQAYERLKTALADDKELLESVRAGDVPDSFRVQVADTEDARAVKAAIDGVPGVDAVIIDHRRPRA